MNQRGRQSLASLAVVEPNQTGISRLMPPPKLTPAERGVWLEIVNSKPADWFGSEHVYMLVDYVRAVCKADVVDSQIKALNDESLETDEGLRRFDRLVGMAATLSGVQKALSTSMRLTHQAIYRKDKAGMGPGQQRKPWQREPSPSP